MFRFVSVYNISLLPLSTAFNLKELCSFINIISPFSLSVISQLCQVLSPTSMLCQAPELPISLARQQEVPERPDEFGFKLDDVQALMALNNSNFIYYPNPEFEPLSVSGVLELKPGSPIILKVGGQILHALTYNQYLLVVRSKPTVRYLLD